MAHTEVCPFSTTTCWWCDWSWLPSLHNYALAGWVNEYATETRCARMPIWYRHRHRYRHRYRFVETMSNRRPHCSGRRVLQLAASRSCPSYGTFCEKWRKRAVSNRMNEATTIRAGVFALRMLAVPGCRRSAGERRRPPRPRRLARIAPFR